jgi:hypothetical protein
MTLIELKNFITSGIVPTDFLILVNKDNQFLAKQYINALGELAPGGLNKISSIYEPFQSSLNLLTAPEGCINVLTVDTFEERSEDYSQFENTVVVCEQVDKSISKVPILGDIPFIGVAFRNSTNKISKNELIIIVTPKIINDDEAITERM